MIHSLLRISRHALSEVIPILNRQRHDGSLPIVGVNTFRGSAAETPAPSGLTRSTEAEKQSQVTRLREFHEAHATETEPALARLKQAATRNENLFAVLMDVVKS